LSSQLVVGQHLFIGTCVGIFLSTDVYFPIQFSGRLNRTYYFSLHHTLDLINADKTHFHTCEPQVFHLQARKTDSIPVVIPDEVNFAFSVLKN
jgi:hypothetical protein